MTLNDAGQEQLDDGVNTLGTESIPEQIHFFNVQFNNVLKEYKVYHLREDVHD